MAKRAQSLPTELLPLGENPVNDYQAREYARESSPSPIAVILELTENARDNATGISLTIDVQSIRIEGGVHYLTPTQIICEDNGTGLTHHEFLTKFCGAFSESEGHHDTARAGRNGVGTKTYLSIADRVIVCTTTGRPMEGIDQHRDQIMRAAADDLVIPQDGEPDSLWRAYEFRLHTRGALTQDWRQAEPAEMGTRVILADIHEGTEIAYETLIERLSFSREWLHSPSHSFTIQLTGNLTDALSKRKPLVLAPWTFPKQEWLLEAKGRSDKDLFLADPMNPKDLTTITPPETLQGVVEFDFRVVGRNADNQMQSLEKPVLLLEVCGALPYPPNLEGVQSERTRPLLAFLELEHSSSIGAFCNSISGWARINSLAIKSLLRNNKTTLASGPGTGQRAALRLYLHSILKVLHRTWYNATRASQDEVVGDALREAEQEVNLALKGVNRSPFRGGQIVRSQNEESAAPTPPSPKRHRWECGSCGKRWLAAAAFTPQFCAESGPDSGARDGCGSSSIGYAKNQPRIGDCVIRIEQLGDSRLPAHFQFEKADEDTEMPVVSVNLRSPRYIELRGTSSMSGQAQKRLKQYLVDVALVAIADYSAKTKGSDFAEELGELYFNRMLRCVGIKQYEAQLKKVLDSTTGSADSVLLLAS